MEEILKILVVDDDARERAAVCQSLLATGELVELCEATDCTQAIALLQEDNFDCIFLDYSLPDAEGLTLLNKLSAVSVGVPIVMLTGQEDEKVAAELMNSGASDYLSKTKISHRLNTSLANVIRTY